MGTVQRPLPRTLEDVFKDFTGRREGLLKALSIDVEKFFDECDPEKDNLCLYGHPDGTWEVTLPVKGIPPAIPEPVLGINFARDGMQRKDWIHVIAIHSDSWLISVAFYFGALFRIGMNDRERLFQMINRLPTISEVVVPKQPNDLSANHNSGQSKSTAGKSRHSVSHTKASNISQAPREEEDEEEEDEEEEDEDEEEDDEQSGVCGVCEESGGEEFWICCDSCQIWFHVRCVKITPAEAKTIKNYKCPICRKNKKIKA